MQVAAGSSSGSLRGGSPFLGCADGRGENDVSLGVAELEIVANCGSQPRGLGGSANRNGNIGLDTLLTIGAIAGRIELGSRQFEAGWSGAK